MGTEKIFVTDHRPLKAIFANRRLGSIRIDRTKLWHQDINYEVIWREGRLNPSHYLRRHPLPATTKHKHESIEDDKLLYYLHDNEYVMELITVEAIQEHMRKDPVLQKLTSHVKNGHTPSTPDLHPYKEIFDELTISATGLLLRQQRIILPQTLQMKAIRIDHKLGHFGSTGLKRLIRAHFYFRYLDTLIENEVKHCEDCQLFTTKSIKEPLKPIYVPCKAWEFISIDFFGPMPSVEHVLVIQDLCTKYPVAALMKHSTTAKSTIQVIDKIFTNYGRPTRYRFFRFHHIRKT